ncbi:protein lifeguard 2 [Strongylocentrotus purpuratus]|uniref:Protein lifeguard 1 n=1 Tax=Strongylocentrotus purpuratus TaxID=7668 RepID=A0A7M7N097_STRPU|nr:protein lifeguard 2 [Strongylocentrotus purpuratus]|eukprot:XP_011683781.1 PREDICTED: protein lifeguard 2 [Strongylocentrotus purpuratus]
MADSDYGEGNFDFVEKEIRHAFIKKVYAILTLQLAVTIGIMCIFILVDEVKEYAQQNYWIFWTAFALTFVFIFVLACTPDLRRRSPINIICLMLFTICEGVLLGLTCTYYDGTEVLLAIGITALITLALTLFAFQTKIDFTLMAGLLYVLLISLLMFGFFAAIFRSDFLYTFYCAFGAFIFSAYIVFDTQLLLGGKHRYSISPEEYIFAALNLYLDIINLFLLLLRLFGSR